ncbi:carbamoyltransferase family protein [Kiloniella laminariae]|uniref:carbamoyltransferase family protein n=1 Tax=Kiloniella laminariae TaxID=454162 RepID=UPI00038116A1|nr:carbamoyltransferase [Kiloniella laminariae]
MLILGISAFYHDSAACLVRDGTIVAAAQEERFTRVKHDASFPQNAIKYCLQEANISSEDLDYVSFYEQSNLKMDRLLKTYLMHAPAGLGSFARAMPLWIREKLWLNKLIRKELGFKGPIISPKHHESHAAGAFYPSPFDKAAFLTMDGVGEWATLSYGVAKGNKLKIQQEIRFPHSLGLLYSAFTYYCGFKVNSGEYKLMGLAPYGKPRYVETILDNLLDLKNDGSFRLDMSYFNYCVDFTMTTEKFHKLFDRAPRPPESEITQLDMDLASSIQKVTEEIILQIGSHIYKETREENLCLSGGVALNCVANGRLYREGPFKRLWIQPASGDAGSALGAALWTWYNHLGNPRQSTVKLDRQSNSYLGPEYDTGQIKAFLESRELPAVFIEDETERCSTIAALIAEGNVIGRFDGRMEFGPRALGSRSILGDPRSETMQSVMNLKIKYRESFRPFAPMVRFEDVREWFDVDGQHNTKEDFSSPYMLMVGHVKKDKCILQNSSCDEYDLNRVNEVRSKIPAVTHVDSSARLQTVHKESNPGLHALISEFKEKTGCPVLINTSFNVRGEPIVESPEDAYRCFMRTEMDALVLGPYLLKKEEQPVYVEEQDWQNLFQLD